MDADLRQPLRIAHLELRNRVLLAPLAGIGNWFVRLQAHRHGAAMAVSEMVSSHALHHRNRRTLEEMLRIDPREGPVAIQLFGSDPDVMRSGAEIAAAAGPDLIDINMGCPVPKVRKTGAGVQLLADHRRAVAVACAAAEGSGLPVTVKLRSGLEPGDRSGLELALRLAAEAGVAAIAFHPRPAQVQHKGHPDYVLARELVEALAARGLEVPVILSGGLRSAAAVRRAHAESGASAVMLARGALGNPWLFAELTAPAALGPSRPSPADRIAELRWVIDRAAEHWGAERAVHNLRKLYPWYLERIGVGGTAAHGFQAAPTLAAVGALLERLETGLDRHPERRFEPLQSAVAATL